MRYLTALLITVLCAVPARTFEMKSFTIRTTPLGEAPLWVREAWKGLSLPSSHHHACDIETLSRSKVPGHRDGFVVPHSVAIEILENRSPEAAAWWRARGYPEDAGLFCFEFEDQVS